MVINKRFDAGFTQAALNVRDEVLSEPDASKPSGHDNFSGRSDPINSRLNSVLLCRKAAHKTIDRDNSVLPASNSPGSQPVSGATQQDDQILALLPSYAAGEDLTTLSRQVAGFASIIGEVGAQTNAEHKQFLARLSSEQRGQVQQAIQVRSASLLRQQHQLKSLLEILPDYASGAVWGQLRQQHPMIHRIFTNKGGVNDSPLAKIFIGSLTNRQRDQVQEAVASRQNAVSYLKLAPHLIQIFRAFANPRNDLSSVAQSLGVDGSALRSVLNEQGLTPRGEAFLAEQSSAVRAIAHQALQQRLNQLKLRSAQVSELPVQSALPEQVKRSNPSEFVQKTHAVELPPHVAQISVDSVRLAVNSCVLGSIHPSRDGLPYAQAAKKSGINEETLRLLLTQNDQGGLEFTQLGKAYMQQCCTSWDRGTFQALIRAINS